MISKDQYLEIIDICEKYVKKRNEVFIEHPLSDDYQQGMLCVIDLIKTLVEK